MKGDERSSFCLIPLLKEQGKSEGGGKRENGTTRKGQGERGGRGVEALRIGWNKGQEERGNRRQGVYQGSELSLGLQSLDQIGLPRLTISNKHSPTPWTPAPLQPLSLPLLPWLLLLRRIHGCRSEQSACT